MSTEEATYLGDGLYATYNRWRVDLFAHNGIENTSRVFLDPATLAAFRRYAERFNDGDARSGHTVANATGTGEPGS